MDLIINCVICIQYAVLKLKLKLKLWYFIKYVIMYFQNFITTFSDASFSLTRNREIPVD